jgi:hypothetical protein
MANGMHSPNSLVHSIYGKDKSSNNLTAAILSQPTRASSLSLNLQKRQPINNIQQSSNILSQNTLIQKPTTQSTIDSFLQIQNNQLNELNKLNEKFLNDSKQLNLAQPTLNSTNLIQSTNLASAQSSLPTNNLLTFSSPITSSNIPSVLGGSKQNVQQTSVSQTNLSQNIIPQNTTINTSK